MHGAKLPSEVVGGRVQAVRKGRTWTQARLAEAIEAHGGALDRAAVAKIESGVRRVSIDEWLLLAAALNVPPVLLLLPLGTAPRVAITSRSVIHPHLALEWLRGDEPLVASNRRSIDTAGWLEGAKPLELWLELRQVQERLGDAWAEVRHADYAGSDEGRQAARERHAEALLALHAHLRRMQEAGQQIPGQAPEVIEGMETIGLDTDGFEVYDDSGDWTLEELAAAQGPDSNGEDR